MKKEVIMWVREVIFGIENYKEGREVERGIGFC